CYRYTLTGVDNVGNSISVSTTVKVDTSDPTISLAPSDATGNAYYPGSGTRVYMKSDAASGGFDLTATVADADSDIASTTFPTAAAMGIGWSASGSGTTRTYSYSGPGAGEPGTKSVSTQNNATRTNSASFSVVDDTTAPAGGALTVNGQAASGATPVAYSSSGSFTIGIRTDYGETQSATESGLAGSILTVRSAGYSSIDTCDTSNWSAPTTITGNPGQTKTTGCYLYTLAGTDNVGNTASVSTLVKVDTSDPTISVAPSNATGNAYYPGSGTRVYMKSDAASGGFDVTATVADAESGIASTTFPTAAALGTNWQISGSGLTRTYSYTGTAGVPGTETVTTQNNGARTANATFSVVDDTAAPAGGALTVNGQ